MSNIKPGDLVMVVKPRPCCGKPGTIGKIFTVKYIENMSYSRCPDCKKLSAFIGVDYEPIGVGGNGGYEIERLIKIDPPPTSEDTTEDLKLHEPA